MSRYFHSPWYEPQHITTADSVKNTLHSDATKQEEFTERDTDDTPQITVSRQDPIRIDQEDTHDGSLDPDPVEPVFASHDAVAPAELEVAGQDTKTATAESTEKSSPVRADDDRDWDRDFFISYTQADREWAEWIAWQLEESGYTVIIQSWDMVPGQNFTIMMEEASRRSRRTIALLSPSYLESVYGREEWRAAYDRDPRGFERRLVPIRVHECDRPGPLRSIISLDIFDAETEEIAQIRLIRGIKAVIDGQNRPATRPAFPGSKREGVRHTPAAVSADDAVSERKPDFPGAN
jgi:hypothetical protein